MSGLLQSGRVDAMNLLASEQYTTGESPAPRAAVISSGGFLAVTGNVFLSYLTANRAEVCNNMRATSGNSAGSANTLTRMGVYSVAANGDLTLVAQTANLGTFFTPTFTTLTAPLTAPFTKQQGQLYALALIAVGGTMPRVFCVGASPAADDSFNNAPRQSAMVTGQADLPASIANGALVSVSGVSGAPPIMWVGP